MSCERGEIDVLHGGGTLTLASGGLRFEAELPAADRCVTPYTARLERPPP